jgi:hypothetical protein
MNKFLLILLLPVFGYSQQTVDTIKKATAFQNSYIAVTSVYGKTYEGHPYVFGINNKYNGWSFNHIVYNVTWDGYNIGRTQGLYPHLYSIKQSTPKQTLSAYPNPVITYLYFKKSGTYTLFDMYGKQVSSTNSSSMYVGKLSAGIYILRNGNNSMKIIKQ